MRLRDGRYLDATPDEIRAIIEANADLWDPRHYTPTPHIPNPVREFDRNYNGRIRDTRVPFIEDIKIARVVWYDTGEYVRPPAGSGDGHIMRKQIGKI